MQKQVSTLLLLFIPDKTSRRSEGFWFFWGGFCKRLSAGRIMHENMLFWDRWHEYYKMKEAFYEIHESSGFKNIYKESPTLHPHQIDPANRKCL